MNALRDDLLAFSHAIVHGDELSPQIDPSCRNYPASTAIEVYRNNYRGNLHAALAGAYPVIEQLVGYEFFRRMTREYIGLHLSRSGNLHGYGEQMASFVGAFPAAQQLAYLPDVAALEWTCHCAYFAPDAALPDISKLSQLEPAQYSDLALSIHPACHVVRSRYPIADIWHAHQSGAPGDFNIDLASGPCLALVIRQDDAVRVIELNQADAEWLADIQAGNTLGVATAAVLERYPNFDLQACLAHLMSRGVFTEFKVGEMS